MIIGAFEGDRIYFDLETGAFRFLETIQNILKAAQGTAFGDVMETLIRRKS